MQPPGQNWGSDPYDREETQGSMTWQYRMCGTVEARLPTKAWEAKWANKKRDRQYTCRRRIEGFEIAEGETLETEGLEGFKEKITVAFAEREEQNQTTKTKDKEDSHVYGMGREAIGLKEYLRG
ncbi:unnamed protein product, partial [Ectocarpus sp. 13 AM-2016]